MVPIRPLFPVLAVLAQIPSQDAQISAIFGNAVMADNCAEWTQWGPCIWLKGDNPRWQRSYFDQLLPGRIGCRGHTFFKLLRERWGTAFSNVVDYLRGVTLSTSQCGYCSYQQSCGRKCHRRGDASSINPLFVAERLCDEVDQSGACTSLTSADGTCNLWPPNPPIVLPNVSEWMATMVEQIPFLNCVPHNNSGRQLCRCCCAPFVPNPEANFRCQLPAGEGNSTDANPPTNNLLGVLFQH